MTQILKAETKSRSEIERDQAKAEIASLVSRLESFSETIPTAISEKLETSLKTLSERKLELADNQTVKIDEIQGILDALGAVLVAVQSVGSQTDKVSGEVASSATKLAGEIAATKSEIVAALQSLGVVVRSVGSDRPVIEFPEQINQKRLFKLLEDIKKAIQAKRSGGTGGVILSGGGTAINAATSTKQDEQTAILTAIAGDVLNPGTVGHGNKTLAMATTDEPIAGETACKRVILQANFDNAGFISVGGNGVATTTGMQLVPGQALDFEISDLASVYVAATNAGDGVRFTYFV